MLDVIDPAAVPADIDKFIIKYKAPELQIYLLDYLRNKIVLVFFWEILQIRYCRVFLYLLVVFNEIPGVVWYLILERIK